MPHTLLLRAFGSKVAMYSSPFACYYLMFDLTLVFCLVVQHLTCEQITLMLK